MNLLESNPPRENFTQRCALYFNVFVPVDEISTEVIVAYQRRGDVLETLIGLHNATACMALKTLEVRAA